MKYWIDFSGYVKVEADSKEDAEQKFWAQFVRNCHEPFSDDVWDLDGIEEAADFLWDTNGIKEAKEGE